MIESEEKRKRLTDAIERWCEHVKATPLLRNGDIQGLVRSILSEFYHIQLSCGHLVRDFSEETNLTFKEYDGSEISGCYCADCVEHYKKELGAWEAVATED